MILLGKQRTLKLSGLWSWSWDSGSEDSWDGDEEESGELHFVLIFS